MSSIFRVSHLFSFILFDYAVCSDIRPQGMLFWDKRRHFDTWAAVMALECGIKLRHELRTPHSTPTSHPHISPNKLRSLVPLPCPLILQKNAVAVAYVRRGKGEIRLNGTPLDLIQPDTLRWKVMEPVLLLGKQRFANVDIRIRVKGGGRVSQIYAIRQAIAKGLVSFYQKFVDEQSKDEIKSILVTYDRTLLVADPRRHEPKKFGGPGARSRVAKSYR